MIDFNQFKYRFEPIKHQKFEIAEKGSFVARSSRPKFLYNYYICDNCGEEIREYEKWQERSGGICKFPYRTGFMTFALCNKCLSQVIINFEDFKQKETEEEKIKNGENKIN